VQAKLQSVECRLGDKPELKLEGSKVLWTFTKGETVLPDPATAFFTDNL
jgi:hypothetical protein